MATLEVGAIDQETTNPRCSHFREGDFLLAAIVRTAVGEGGTYAIEARPDIRVESLYGLGFGLI
jgi:hypothetical protein